MKKFKYGNQVLLIPLDELVSSDIVENCYRASEDNACQSMCDDCLFNNDRAFEKYLKDTEEDRAHSFGDNL